MELLFALYSQLHRKAPGSEASTRRAVTLLGEIPADARVLDLGCGSGASSLVLAEALPASQLTAVDIYQPFLDDLIARANDAGHGDRINLLCADMTNVPLDRESFDVVWSEGALYVLGFEAGLRRCRKWLRPGGLIAISELTWLTSPPPGAATFFRTEYPAMTGVADNQRHVREAGFEMLNHFVLPPEDWANYYEPLEAALPTFRDQHADNPSAQLLADDLQREVDIWRDYGDSFGYVFYMARA